MAFSASQLDALQAAYATGTLEVSYDGRTVKYRSLAELERAIGVVAQALGLSSPLAPTGGRNRIGLVAHTRG